MFDSRPLPRRHRLSYIGCRLSYIECQISYVVHRISYVDCHRYAASPCSPSLGSTIMSPLCGFFMYSVFSVVKKNKEPRCSMFDVRLFDRCRAGVVCCISNVVYRMSFVESRLSNLECRISNVGCRLSLLLTLLLELPPALAGGMEG
jgi:hypothetical protein